MELLRKAGISQCVPIILPTYLPDYLSGVGAAAAIAAVPEFEHFENELPVCVPAAEPLFFVPVAEPLVSVLAAEPLVFAVVAEPQISVLAVEPLVSAVAALFPVFAAVLKQLPDVQIYVSHGVYFRVFYGDVYRE